MPDDQVQFQSPTTGQVQGVPSEHWDEALNRGYKPVSHVVMYSTEGQRGMVPKDQVADMQKQGYQTTPKTEFEKERTEGEHGFFNAVKRQLPGLFASPGEDVTPSVAKLQQGAQNPPADKSWNLMERFRRGTEAGDSSPFGKTATGVAYAAGPAVGMDPQAAEERAAKGDTGGVAGRAAVPAVQAAAPLALEGGQALADSKAGQALAAPARSVASKVGGMWSPEAAPSLVKALKPSVRIPNASESFALAGPDIAAEVQKTGGRINDFESLNQHTTAAKKTLWQGVAQKNAAGHAIGAQIDGNVIADAMEGSIDERTRQQNPRLVEQIKNAADTYRRPIPVDQAEDFLQSVNNELHSYYAKNKVSREVASRDPATGHVVAEGDALRKALGDKLDELGGTKYSDLKRRYGALSDVEQAAVHQQDIAARRAPVPLYEAMGRMAGLGDLASAGKNILDLKGGSALGDLASGSAKFVMGKRMAQLNSPEWLLENAFHGPNAFQPRATPFEPVPAAAPPKALLEKPATPMPGPGAADTSGSVRGGRWTTPRALLPAPAEALPPGGSPPQISPQFAREAIGNLGDETRLGARGQGGVRQPVRGLLPNATGPAAEATAPPAVSPDFAKEAIGSVKDASRLGARGQGGTRVASGMMESARRATKGELPGPPTIESLGLVDKGEVVKGSGIRQFELADQPGKTVALKPAQLKGMTPREIADYVRKEVAKKASAPTADELKARLARQ